MASKHGSIPVFGTRAAAANSNSSDPGCCCCCQIYCRISSDTTRTQRQPQVQYIVIPLSRDGSNKGIKKKKKRKVEGFGAVDQSSGVDLLVVFVLVDFHGLPASLGQPFLTAFVHFNGAPLALSIISRVSFGEQPNDDISFICITAWCDVGDEAKWGIS